MSEIIKIVKRREIKVKGIFDINNLYKKARLKIVSLGYDFFELEQTIKDLDKGKDMVVRFEGERKFDELTKFYINVDIHFENIFKNRKDNIVLDKGSAKVVMSCWLVLDYKNKWNANAITKFLFHIYINYIIKFRILDIYADKIEGEFNELHNLIKENLNLYA